MTLAKIGGRLQIGRLLLGNSTSEGEKTKKQGQKGQDSSEMIISRFCHGRPQAAPWGLVDRRVIPPQFLPLIPTQLSMQYCTTTNAS